MMHSAQYDITTECIYVFGGCDHFDTFDDFWRFDIASYQWHKIGSASNGATVSYFSRVESEMNQLFK